MTAGRSGGLLRAGLALGLAGVLALPGGAGASAARSRARDQEEPKPATRLDPPPATPSRAAAPSPDASAQELGPDERAVLGEAGDLFLEVAAGPKETGASLGKKYLSDPRRISELMKKGARAAGRGEAVRIPYAALNDAYKLRTIHDLFPRDGPRDGDWVHHAGAGRVPVSEESLWHLALWLTGSGENFEVLADRNGITDLSPRRGQEVVVPGDILLPAFAAQAGRTGPSGTQAPDDDFTEATSEGEGEGERPPPSETATIPMAEGAEDLAYAADALGRHAIYRLKQGEALYSAVVVRYTGRVDAQDVNDLAQQIAARSGITDVTDIPIGFRVKIPLELLLPEYLPRDDPRRQGWEKSQAEVARYTNRASSRNLQGVAVILDAGHGGRDSGAAHNGVWEHDFVYDILCRIKAILEARTQARVLPTIKDKREGYRIHETARLPRSRAEVLLTDPPFSLQSRGASVNLRWYLANAQYRRLVAEGFDPLKVIFTSLHADARHPSLRGAMVYVPGEEYRRGRYGHGEAIYTRYREVREEPYVSFPQADRERSEGLSRQFASALVSAFRSRGVMVHPFGPVRERIIRRGRSWVPAVLRCNAVPVEVLIEVSNLSNPADGRLLGNPAYRQKVAEAYVDALILYYGGAAQGPRTVKSASAGGR